MDTVKTLMPINDTFFEIRGAILSREKIRQLLKYDDPDALKKEVPDINSVKDCVYLAPVVDIPGTEWKKHSYIMIDLPKADTDYEDDGEKTSFFSIAITVICDYKNWELENEKLRALVLADEVIKAVDNRKFSLSGKLYVASVEGVIIDKQLYGYVLKVFTDDSAEEVSL